MADKPGFLESLGISPVDERAIAEAVADKNRSAIDRQFRQKGIESGQALAGLIGGTASAIQDKSFGSFGEGRRKARAAVDDQMAAQAAGISINQLNARREVRNLSVSDSNRPEDRMSQLKKVAAIANKWGDFELLGNTLNQMQAVRTEEVEFNKLKAGAKKVGFEAGEAGEVPVVVDGIRTFGVRGENEKGEQGVWHQKGNAMTFTPWGDRAKVDQTALGSAVPEARMSKAALLKKYMTAKEWDLVKNTIHSQESLLSRYDSMLGRLSEAAARGDAHKVVGKAGQAIAWLDNNLKAAVGIADSFVTGETFLEDANLRQRWRSKSANPNDAFWSSIGLPAEMQNDSAEAQQWRAQLMEMAYLVARAAEPSNRGLSDKDIVQALQRLGGASSNPQVFVRRAMELIAEGLNEVDSTLKKHYGAYQGDERLGIPAITNEDIDQIMGGELLSKYRTGVQDLYKKHGATLLADGRVYFDQARFGPDVNPAGGSAEETQSLSLDDLLKGVEDL